MRSQVIRSRDGLNSVIYYSLPLGGPLGRDSWGYNHLHRWLAHRGELGLGRVFVHPDEDHGVARPENNQSFYAVTEAFLATARERQSP